MSDRKTHRPRKRFGQHFLNDAFIIQQIISAIRPEADQHVVEIGPGMGVLTEQLLPLVAQLDVVELDRDLVPKLKATFLPMGNFRIYSADALKFNFCELTHSTNKIRLVGNLPYNISTQLIFHLLEQIHCIEDMHFMLQKEVVDRLAAQPGTSDYGKLTVLIQYHCQVESLLYVPPSAFSPPPKVDSAVVRLIPYDKPPVEISDWQQFKKLVIAAFAQKRKTLRNNMKGLISSEQLQAINIDPSRRAETLSLQEFALMSHVFADAG